MAEAGLRMAHGSRGFRRLMLRLVSVQVEAAEKALKGVERHPPRAASETDVTAITSASTHGTLINPVVLWVGEHCMPPPALNGLRILVVEDEPVIALHIAQTLTEAGAEVIGPTPTTARALRLMDCSHVDAAVVDYRLEGETASLLARRLVAMGVPFLFHTSSGGSPALIHPDVPILNKPSRPQQLVAAVCALTGRLGRSE